MKRSKIFLGVTTCLLAVAGIAAAKKFNPATTRFYYSLAGTSISHCFSSAAVTCVQDITKSTNCTFAFVTHSFGSDHTHNVHVYTHNDCTSPLLYTKTN